MDVAGDKQFGNRTFHVDDKGNASYDIVGGDTLWAIASNVLKGQGVEAPSNTQIWEVINAIAAENQIANPNLIYAGAKLQVSKELLNKYRAGATPAVAPTEDPAVTPDDPADPYVYN